MLDSIAKGEFVSRAKSLKEMLKDLQRASERRAECERRLARLAQENFGDAIKAARIVERTRKEADSPEFAIPRKRALLKASGLLPTQGGRAIPALLDAAATERVVRAADVRVRDLLTGRANEKLARARGGRPWEYITYESLGRWEKQEENIHRSPGRIVDGPAARTCLSGLSVTRPRRR